MDHSDDDERREFFEANVRSCGYCGAPFRISMGHRGHFCGEACRRRRELARQHRDQVKRQHRLRSATDEFDHGG